ncbi:hypothetical protein ACW7G2_03265 [Luteimonas sp. A277]
MTDKDVAAALAAALSVEVITGVAKLLHEFAGAIPEALLPPNRAHVFAQLVAGADSWRIVSHPGHRWPVVRSPYTADKTPFVCSVDLTTLTPEGGDAMRYAVPAHIVAKLVELGHGYRLWHADAKGNA